MIIVLGNYRLRSHRNGWMIEARKLRKADGSERWEVDSHPATLADGLEAVLLKILKDGEDCHVSELPQRIRAAHGELVKHISRARAAV